MSLLRLGLDPGKTTGYSWWSGTSMIDSGAILGGLEGFKEWWFESDWPGKPAQIVSEQFVPSRGFRGLDQTYSLLIEGAVRFSDYPVTLQLPSMKATLIKQHDTGDKGERERRDWLASKGLHFETKHAMDAATHVLVERKKARDMVFWKRYWK